MDEIDVDSYFNQDIYDVCQSQRQMARVSKGFNKKCFAVKLFQFCNLKAQLRYIRQEQVNICKRELSFLVESLPDFLKTFDKASKCLKVPSAKPKFEIGSTKWKGNPFVQFYKDVAEHLNRQIALSFRFRNNHSYVSSSKKFEVHGNQFKHTEIVKLNIPEIHHLRRNRYYNANNFGRNESNYDV